MAQLLVFVSLLVAGISAAPGFDYGFPDFHSAGIFKTAPVFSAPAAPVIPAPYIPEAPLFKAFSAPVISSPIIKTPIFAPAPVIKHVAPATSYSTITQFVSHPAPILKTVVAPQPILKSFAVAVPLPVHGYPGLPAFHH